MSATGAPGDLRVIIAGSGFRRLVVTRLTSQIADGWFQAALAGSVLFNPERQASPIAIATGFAVLLLPYSLLGPFVGVFLDRWQRRTSLSLANLVRAALVLPAAALLARGDEGLPFVVCALLVIAANRFFLAGLGAALPHVVDDERLVTANAVASTIGTVAYAVGLGTAAVLMGTPLVGVDFDGYASLALLGAAGYVVSALLLRAFFSRTALGPDDAAKRTDATFAAVADVARGMVAGLRHLAQRRAAGYAVLVQSGQRALSGVLTLALLLIFTRHFTSADGSGSLSGLGLVIVAGGAGVLVAAVLTPIATRRMPGWAWVSIQLGTAGFALLVLAPPFRAPLLLICAFLLNISSQSTKIVVDTAMQRECDDPFRGRVFSVNDTAFNAAMVAGLFVGSALLPSDGRSVGAVVAVAVGYGVLAGWYAFVGRRSDRSLVHERELADALTRSSVRRGSE
jgi:MFS family permease